MDFLLLVLFSWMLLHYGRGVLVDGAKLNASDTYECVDIYKQPAFNHPSLKDHIIQMKPSSLPKRVKHRLAKVTSEAIECPQGTVPIRKTPNLKTTLAAIAAREHYAAARNSANSKDIIYGSQIAMDIINVRVEEDQASLALVSLWDETDGNTDMIQAGWAVAPQLYEDHQVHFISFWKAGNSGCFNLLCPGFIQVASDYPVDRVLNEHSTPNGKQFVLEILIHLDPIKKNWWLTLPAISKDIGYWPGSTVPRLGGGATRVSWGGVAKHSSQYSPPMGFGNFPDGNFSRSAYMRNMQVMYTPNNLVDPAGAVETYVDNKNCYGAWYDKLTDRPGYAIQYGGPGGSCDN